MTWYKRILGILLIITLGFLLFVGTNMLAAGIVLTISVYSWFEVLMGILLGMVAMFLLAIYC